MEHTISSMESSTTFYAMADSTGSGIYFAGINWDPAPFVSMSIEKYTVGDYTIGGLMNVTLNGVLHGDSFGTTADKLIDKLETLRVSIGCINDINIGCGGTNIIQSGLGWIKGYSFPEGEQKNWYNIIPYNIELAIIQNKGKPIVPVYSNGSYLKSYKSNISYSMDDKIWQTYAMSGLPSGLPNNHIYSNEYITVKYNVEAQGLGICNCTNYASGLYGGLDAAYNILQDTNTIGPYRISGTGVCSTKVNIFPTGYSSIPYNHTRNVSINGMENLISIDGEYIIRPTGVNQQALLTLESNTDASLESAERNVTLTGNVKGLVPVYYTDLFTSVNRPALSSAASTAASSALSRLIQDTSGILSRRVGVSLRSTADNLKPLYYGTGIPTNYKDHIANDSITYRLMQQTYKTNHADGSIDFSLVFSNKNRYKIPNALWADINIEHELSSRRLVEHVVPGRGYPITQDILCGTLDSYTITVNAQFEPTQDIHKIINGARGTVLLLIYNTTLSLGLTNWVTTQDNESIGNNGSYRRTMKLTRPSCFDSNLLSYSRMNPPNFLNVDN